MAQSDFYVMKAGKNNVLLAGAATNIIIDSGKLRFEHRTVASDMGNLVTDEDSAESVLKVNAGILVFEGGANAILTNIGPQVVVDNAGQVVFKDNAAAHFNYIATIDPPFWVKSGLVYFDGNAHVATDIIGGAEPIKVEGAWILRPAANGKEVTVDGILHIHGGILRFISSEGGKGATLTPLALIVDNAAYIYMRVGPDQAQTSTIDCVLSITIDSNDCHLVLSQEGAVADDVWLFQWGTDWGGYEGADSWFEEVTADFGYTVIGGDDGQVWLYI